MIGSHFVPLEGKFVLIALVIHRLFVFENNTLNFHRKKAQITRDS
jgi:hypothetical protein